jgi:hypothetical protein
MEAPSSPAGGSPFANASSLTFAGAASGLARLPSCDGIMRVGMPVAGLPPPHWRW